jgi:hypothetical protein
MRIVSVLVVLWLVIGALAAFQRGYFSNDEKNCAEIGTIAVTVVAGPLNYVGVNPKIKDCNAPDVPQPSK